MDATKQSGTAGRAPDPFAVLGNRRGQGRPPATEQMTAADVLERADVLAAICQYELDELLRLLSQHAAGMGLDVERGVRECHIVLMEHSPAHTDLLVASEDRAQLEQLIWRMEAGLREIAQRMDKLISTEPLSRTLGTTHDWLLNAKMRIARVGGGGGLDVYPARRAALIKQLLAF